MLDVINTKRPSISLDEMDLLLIEQLKDDARQPISALSRKLGVNRETVRYRMNRLMAEGALMIVCTSNLERLGYQFMIMIGVRTRHGKIDSVATQLAGLPGVVAVSLAASHYNIVVWAFIRDQLDFKHFVAEELSNVPDATSIEIMHTFHYIKDFWKPLKPKTQPFCGDAKKKLSELDLSIIKAMQQYPRQSITDLAKAIGYGRPVAKNRLDKLIEDRVIGFWPIVDPAVLGYNYWVLILIKSEPDKVKAVAHELAEKEEIMHVSLITGRWQVNAVALCSDSRHMFTFSSEALNSIPGIITSETITLGKIIKFSINVVDWM